MHCFILGRQMGLSKGEEIAANASCNVTPAKKQWLNSLVVESMHHTETNRVALGMCCINMTAPQGKELKS